MPAHPHFPYDVIIAGGGPVGLFLACELRLAGCSVLLLERSADATSPLKALPFGLRGLTLPTIDSLDRRGLLAELQARAVAGGGAATAHWTGQPRQPAGHFAGLQFYRDRVDEAAWPWRMGNPAEMLAVTIADVETALATRAAELGAVMRYDCGVDALEQQTDGVIVHASGEVFRTGWLVGCDGGRSTVRKAAGIGFGGTEPEFTGYSLQVRLAEPHRLRPGRHHTPTGMYTYAPPGTIAMVDFDGGVSHRAEPIVREHAEAVLRRVSGSDIRAAALDVATTWTDRAFLATDYREGRVLLAGDAAHVHAPLGGQGLNLGLGDAMNLGWKLAATVNGDAPPDLLASYETERRPVAEQVLDWSRAQVALMRPDRGAAALRAIVRDLVETRDGATYFAGRVWGAGLHYELGGTHPLIGRSAPDVALADGTRLNEHLRTGRSLLLDLKPAAPLRGLAAPCRGRIDYLAGAVADECGFNALLVRPDGVVAWASTGDIDLDEASQAISHWLGDVHGGSGTARLATV